MRNERPCVFFLFVIFGCLSWFWLNEFCLSKIHTHLYFVCEETLKENLEKRHERSEEIASCEDRQSLHLFSSKNWWGDTMSVILMWRQRIKKNGSHWSSKWKHFFVFYQIQDESLSSTDNCMIDYGKMKKSELAMRWCSMREPWGHDKFEKWDEGICRDYRRQDYRQQDYTICSSRRLLYTSFVYHRQEKTRKVKYKEESRKVKPWLASQWLHFCFLAQKSGDSFSGKTVVHFAKKKTRFM